MLKKSSFVIKKKTRTRTILNLCPEYKLIIKKLPTKKNATKTIIWHSIKVKNYIENLILHRKVRGYLARYNVN